MVDQGTSVENPLARPERGETVLSDLSRAKELIDKASKIDFAWKGEMMPVTMAGLGAAYEVNGEFAKAKQIRDGAIDIVKREEPFAVGRARVIASMAEQEEHFGANPSIAIDRAVSELTDTKYEEPWQEYTAREAIKDLAVVAARAGKTSEYQGVLTDVTTKMTDKSVRADTQRVVDQADAIVDDERTNRGYVEFIRDNKIAGKDVDMNRRRDAAMQKETEDRTRELRTLVIDLAQAGRPDDVELIAREISETEGDKWVLGSITLNELVVRMHLERNDYREKDYKFNKALEAARKINDQKSRGSMLGMIAYTAVVEGEKKSEENAMRLIETTLEPNDKGPALLKCALAYAERSISS